MAVIFAAPAAGAIGGRPRALSGGRGPRVSDVADGSGPAHPRPCHTRRCLVRRLPTFDERSAADASAFPAPAAQPAPERPPRPAATIVVVRDGAGGIEVLLSRRAERGDHNSGAWVFPGGIVDAARPRRRTPPAYGIDDARGQRAGSAWPSGGLDYYVAAIRECFEESGLLFGRAIGDSDDRARRRAPRTRLAPWRGALHRRERGIAEMCAQEGIRLDADALVYLSHWLTPLGRAKRYDTRFFIAAAPASQVALARRHRDGRAALDRARPKRSPAARR